MKFTLAILVSIALSGSAVAADKPALAKKGSNSLKTESREEAIDRSISELSVLLRDARMNPGSETPALLEDFREELELPAKQATLTTDDLAKNRGLQGEIPAQAATELE